MQKCGSFLANIIKKDAGLKCYKNNKHHGLTELQKIAKLIKCWKLKNRHDDKDEKWGYRRHILWCQWKEWVWRYSSMKFFIRLIFYRKIKKLFHLNISLSQNMKYFVRWFVSIYTTFTHVINSNILRPVTKDPWKGSWKQYWEIITVIHKKMKFKLTKTIN